MKVLNYTRAKTGLLVTRSENWNREHCVNPNADTQFGILVDKTFHEDQICEVVCFPVIFWEGQAMESATHPANVVPYREKDRTLPEIEMEGEL